MRRFCLSIALLSLSMVASGWGQETAGPAGADAPAQLPMAPASTPPHASRRPAPYQPPTVVAPVQTPVVPSMVSPTGAPAAASAAPRPPTISSCDPSGCWDSNGTRLNQVGPILQGPRGFCTVQGNFVYCP